MLDLWTELLERIRELPVSRELAPADVASALALEVPEEPMEPDALLAHLRELVFEQSVHVGHPAFLAYIVGAGTVPAAAAELLAAGLNPNVGGYRLSPGASQIELHLTRWLADRFGLPEGAGGLVMTGGAMASFVALKCARDDRLGADVREAGVAAARPLAVCATAGSTTTGSIDPLPALAALAAEHDCWLHVDAAYGGAAILSETLAPLLAGIERADSLVVDPHKWLYTPQSAGVVLLRDFGALSRSFQSDASYIWLDEAARHGIDFAMHGPEFSRGFAALKVWISLLAHGRAAYGRRIAHDAALAGYLGELVKAHPDFELMVPPRLSVCCFRYRPAGWTSDEETLDRLNERLMTAIHADGRVYCSNAVIDGRFGLRACVVNFRTEAEDMDQMLAVAAELGELEHQRTGV